MKLFRNGMKLPYLNNSNWSLSGLGIKYHWTKDMKKLINAGIYGKQLLRTCLPIRRLQVFVIFMLLGLPFAVWLDLRHISVTLLLQQAKDINAIISSIRSYYTGNVVGRVQEGGGHTVVVHNYLDVSGAIPIPATLSLELGKVIGEKQGNIEYRFVSDYPFRHRAPHSFDSFELESLRAMRIQPHLSLTNVSWSYNTSKVRVVVPVIMGSACVGCHNSNPDSPKHDWRVGDVRGIQEVSITEPIVTNILAFKYLLLYFLGCVILGAASMLDQRKQASALSRSNADLASANYFLEDISRKLSRYLSPQVFFSIFSGHKDVKIATERKRLTIFFSDIKDFTATTESTQPEQLTILLNEYFTEMSDIALRFGGTIDKFIGDAMLIFFGDPESRGAVEDARSCVRMAFAMQMRLAELNVRWRTSGVEHPFQVRMGINTGYCNVGNFGSDSRMDYTIIGAEANLASRLQSVAAAGEIILSYETYALVSDIVDARVLEPIQVKGIARQVVPYKVLGLVDDSGTCNPVISEQVEGFTFYLDFNTLTPEGRKRVMAVMRTAMTKMRL